jgi:hypothetical protein
VFEHYAGEVVVKDSLEDFLEKEGIFDEFKKSSSSMQMEVAKLYSSKWTSGILTDTTWVIKNALGVLSVKDSKKALGLKIINPSGKIFTNDSSLRINPAEKMPVN